ncbi:DUF2141 domain-containing protein [Sandarakinorhabdus sp.]|uniref:DUF2141 domain-containing protein n=1 Tax=Sandarakinorhabdus sp. TaxID=1916663 RepID=UPI00286E282D|nr:DUF2141 domain-containing protein [Sandarakinorhabdus sp.]
MILRNLAVSTTMSAFFLLAATAMPAPAAAQQPTSTLTITFDGIAAPTGAIMIALFDSEAAHDKGGKPVRGGMVSITGVTAQFQVPGLSPGRYAIKVYHDINGNGQMDSNPFGIPTEPFAFSNNALPQGGPATWAQASFEVGAGAATTAITIR